MNRPGRWGALLLLVAAVVLGCAPAAGAAEDGGYAADRVVVVGVPGLAWSDVDPERTPQLWALAERSAIGAVSVRAARSTSCLLDGWATLGAGNRARHPGPDEPSPPVPLPTVPLPEEQAGPPADPGSPPGPGPGSGTPPAPVDTSLSHCGLQEQVADVGLTDPLSTVAQITADDATARFGAEPGALGEAVGCAGVAGRAAVLAVARPGVRLTSADALPRAPAALTGLLSACPLTVVSLDDLADAGAPGAEPTDTGTEPARRATALARIDDSVGRLQAAVAALPGETLLLLQGISEVNDGRAQLHVGIAAGPGFSSPAWLSSASTGRTPFVQLIDVAPTALRALGRAPVPSMNGQPVQASGSRPALDDAVAELRRANTAATVHYRSTGTFFLVLVAVNTLVVGLGLLTLGARRRADPGSPARERLRGPLRAVSLAVAALPVATYLANLAPWERAPAPRMALAGAVLAATVGVAAVAGLGPWRRPRLGPPTAVLAITLGTLLGDVLTGSHLELNGLLGYDPIVAGRFTGYGNLTFGLLSVSALLLTAATATALGRRVPAARARVVVAGAVLGIGLVTVGLVGAPAFGRDFGGVLAALPGFLLLAMLLTGTRVTVGRMAAVLAIAVGAVGTLAVLDWLRPVAERSHLGRFVEQVLTGRAWTVIGRKASANLDVLISSALSWMLPIALLAAVWLLRPGGLLRSTVGTGPAGLPARDAVVLRAGLLCSALSLAIGAAVNDSGMALPATAAALLVPLLVWLAAARRPAGADGEEPPGGAPGSGPAEGPHRVTVGSRGSTVWNA